jgi:hypothetical protein
MARIDNGDPLTDFILQPGWKLTDDGYGLRTLNATYKTDKESSFDFTRGDPFVVEGFEYCCLHKQTATFDLLGIQSQNCDYIGISPDVNEGEYTNPQVNASNGLTAENITSHPNFFVEVAEFTGGVIAGLEYEQTDIAPLVSAIDPVTGKAKKVKGWIGEHGACFENVAGGRFVGFVDPTFASLYGKTQYLASTTSYSGSVYIAKENAFVQAFQDNLGKTSSDNTWNTNLPEIVPAYLGTVFTAADTEFDQLLLSQVNFDDFGLLVKVMYEVRYSRVGWNDAVYAPAAIPE